ncbi:hypothetical protein CSC2_48010 [Clostridium zeae]|uniref:Uncharacterized protein n=1 Tax=Clostridium zeae TaxID=2759022 RepID=A0ABQ1EI25_9CLOT|nr:hypothetical protein [Clostridium zeae]GFZ34275.1 hypothetical protein CSC2_48010 [Clostridium zeae]
MANKKVDRDFNKTRMKKLYRIFKQTFEYYIVLPLIVYFIGFIYSQGTLLLPMETINMFNIPILPYSSKYMIFHGITIIGMYSFVICIYLFFKNSINNEQNKKKPSTIWKKARWIVVYLNILFMFLFYLILLEFKSEYFYMIVLSIYYVFKVLTIISYVEVFNDIRDARKEKSENMNSENEIREVSNAEILKYITLALVIFLNIFVSGSNALIEKYFLYTNGDGSFQVADISDNDGKVFTVYPIDISEKYFIGLSLEDLKVVVKPTEDKNKILFRVDKKNIKVIKYNKDEKEQILKYLKNEESLYNDYIKAIESVNGIYQYSYYTQTVDAKKLISIISDSLYKEKFNLISSEYLNDLLKNSIKENEEKKLKLIGYEVSLPQYDKIHHTYTIYSREIWNSNTIWYKYVLVKQGDKFYVDSYEKVGNISFKRIGE